MLAGGAAGVDSVVVAGSAAVMDRKVSTGTGGGGAGGEACSSAGSGRGPESPTTRSAGRGGAAAVGVWTGGFTAPAGAAGTTCVAALGSETSGVAVPGSAVGRLEEPGAAALGGEAGAVSAGIGNARASDSDAGFAAECAPQTPRQRPQTPHLPAEQQPAVPRASIARIPTKTRVMAIAPFRPVAAPRTADRCAIANGRSAHALSSTESKLSRRGFVEPA